ncbi:MAG: HAMP domain-containing sensor histidine kinase [Chryseosolibacter sp.]
MRLLQVNIRGLLLYSVVLVLISIPVSLFSIQAILAEEVDESIAHQADQFLTHIKSFEYLDDLETDLKVLDKLSNNIHIRPADNNKFVNKDYQTTSLYDSIEHAVRPFRQMSSHVLVKGKPYILTVQMSLVDNNDLVMAIGLVQITVSVLLVGGLLFLNRSLSKRLWKPFYKTLDQLKAYELDKSESIAIESSNINEFNDLNKTVSHLTERNRRVFLNQKEFIENASHEIQTPLAIFQSKLDTLMQSPNLSQMEADTIMDLESTAQRIARLNKNLLLLSKIDNEQFLQTEPVNVDEIIRSQIDSLAPMAALESTKITAELATLTIYANKTLVEVLISNLLHNAIRYGAKKETIGVTLNDKRLSISNIGVARNMNIEQMTQRFSKESSDPNSSGLGLAIVKKICDSCGYKLEYSFSNSTHIFSVNF